MHSRRCVRWSFFYIIRKYLSIYKTLHEGVHCPVDNDFVLTGTKRRCTVAYKGQKSSCSVLYKGGTVLLHIKTARV